MDLDNFLSRYYSGIHYRIYKDNKFIGKVSLKPSDIKYFIKKEILSLKSNDSFNLLKESPEHKQIDKTSYDIPSRKVFEIWYDNKFLGYKSQNIAKFLISRKYGIFKEYNTIELFNKPPESIRFDTCDQNGNILIEYPY